MGGNIEERRRADKDRVGKVKWTEDKKENEEKGKTERKWERNGNVALEKQTR